MRLGRVGSPWPTHHAQSNGKQVYTIVPAAGSFPVFSRRLQRRFCIRMYSKPPLKNGVPNVVIPRFWYQSAVVALASHQTTSAPQREVDTANMCSSSFVPIPPLNERIKVSTEVEYWSGN